MRAIEGETFAAASHRLFGGVVDILGIAESRQEQQGGRVRRNIC